MTEKLTQNTESTQKNNTEGTSKKQTSKPTLPAYLIVYGVISFTIIGLTLMGLILKYFFFL